MRLPAKTLTAALAALALSVPATAAARELPLGPRSLEERRSSEAVAPGVRLTHIVRSGRRDGPWRVNVLRISAPARLGAVLADGFVPGRETVSAMAAEAGAVAAVNGGFFGSTGLFDGDPIGALAIGGSPITDPVGGGGIGVGAGLVSEPVGGRAALLLPGGTRERAAVAGLRFAGAVDISGTRRLLDGVNRARGKIPSCGGRGGDSPTQRPGGATVCSDPSELILYTPAFGVRTGTDGSGAEAIVTQGVVTRLREGGNSRIPADGYVLSGSGDAADLLVAAAPPGAAPALDLALRHGERRLRPGSYGAVVGGGPRLVKRGRLRVRTVAEGFSAAFAARNPRTLAGVARDGDVLLVTVDGRQRQSVGVTLREAARLMRSLGARNAMNLDGGGSSAMVVAGDVVNRPSDGGERAVSDAIVVMAE
jgi:hypothetical protein